MELRISKLGILGLIFSIIGLVLFAGLDTSLNLGTMLSIQLYPAIGAVILGIGLAILFHERNLLATILTSLAFLVLGILNLFAIGFGLGILLPGITGKFKSLPTYLAALMVFLAGFYSATIHPYHYKSMLLDQITELATANTDAYKSALESQVESMLPDMERARQLAQAMVPCVNETYKEQCEAIQEQLANQIYQQTHTKEYKKELLGKLESISLDKESIKESIKEMPMIKSLLDNIAIIVGGLEAMIFLVYAGIFLSIPHSITQAILGLVAKKKETS